MTQKQPWVFRQGDVMVRECAAIPDTSIVRPLEQGKVVLAHGEVTGHMHAAKPHTDARATAYGASDDAFWMGTPIGTGVTHDEHFMVPVPARVRGCEVIRQREHSEAGDRRVQD